MLLIIINLRLFTARLKAGAVSSDATLRRTLSQLLNGTYLAAAQSSSSPLSYLDNPVSIVYAVGNYIDAFSYWLDIGSGVEIQQIRLNDDQFDVLQDRLHGREWSSDIPTGSVGGIINHTFDTHGVYPVIFVVSGHMTHNGHEERVEVATNVTIATLQV